ncbi:MAG: class I SAM-dependent methyltransferase, partial [Bacteroidales bacterium]|nr:class I SAM-dependent methyltransferase [Bacteroidales bacterium]
KKIIVASEVSKALSLGNVTTVNARAASLPQFFAHVVSRAVTSLDNFYPWVKGKFSGSILYLKGGDIVPEIAELMKKNRLRTGAVSTWPIETWLKDEYFKEKFVIEIEK